MSEESLQSILELWRHFTKKAKNVCLLAAQVEISTDHQSLSRIHPPMSTNVCSKLHGCPSCVVVVFSLDQLVD